MCFPASLAANVCPSTCTTCGISRYPIANPLTVALRFPVIVAPLLTVNPPEILAAPPTERPLRLPTDVILGCDGLVRVPCMLVEDIAPAVKVPETCNVDKVPRPVIPGCEPDDNVPVIFGAVMLDAVMLEVEILPAWVFPETDKDDKVPTAVILGCEAVVNVPEMLVALIKGLVRDAEFMEVLTVNEFNVPVCVIKG